MKKTLIFAGLTAFMLSSTMTFASGVTPDTNKGPQNCPKQEMQKHQRPNIDERLKLTEEQKTKAHAIRMKGHEKIKPVIEQIKAKKQEAEAVKLSRIAVQEQEKRLAVIKADIQKLKEQAREIRKENTKEFEAILTADQKKEFEKIKQEGREKFKKHKMDKKRDHGKYNGENKPHPCPLNK